jgi:hypothetical protein
MFKALQNLLGLQPWRTTDEVWADVLSYSPEQNLLTCLFTNSGGFVRDPQFLSRWGWQIRAMNEELYPPRTSTDYVLQRWVQRLATANSVDHLLGETDLGFDLFAASLTVSPEVIGPDYDDADHNGGFVRLNCSGALPVVVGCVGAPVVAQERLAALFRVGAKPLVAARVQANHSLYQPGRRNAPAMVVFSFDPAVSPMKLCEVAEMIFELKSSDTQNPVLQAAAAGPRASDQFWFYHRRFRIPPELTEGRVIYAADLWVHRPYLADGYFSPRTPRLVPVLVQPGDVGGVELVPHDQTARLFPPAQLSLFRLT